MGYRPLEDLNIIVFVRRRARPFDLGAAVGLRLFEDLEVSVFGNFLVTFAHLDVFQGHPWARANRRTSRFPFLAAAAHVVLS